VPGWIQTRLQQDRLEDETDFVQLGSEAETELLTLDVREEQTSSWMMFPERYKFISF
jgi:hypothetical protein